MRCTGSFLPVARLREGEKEEKRQKKDGAGGEVAGGVHGASRLGTVAVIDELTFGMIAGEQFAAMKK